MKICDLHTGRIRLTRATKELRERWQETADYWHDENSREFERKHLEPLAPLVTLMLAAVGRLSEVLEQAERDCLDENE